MIPKGDTRRLIVGALIAGGTSLAVTGAYAAEPVASSSPSEVWFGAELAPEQGGWRVMALGLFGPAARAGLRSGDLVIALTGGALRSLPTIIAGRPGDQIELDISRGQSTRTFRLVLEARQP